MRLPTLVDILEVNIPVHNRAEQYAGIVKKLDLKKIGTKKKC